ncbi:MAG TPA: hypothetical protein VFM06_10435 [Candidatus Limnocylindria bacterium]|nr:hypothetical protein [Candidatus Limnocylindria bacterium]
MHRTHRLVSATAGVALAVLLLLTSVGVANAHERRNVGPYLFVVGWLNEPAFAGAANAATVRVSDTRETPAKPVEGLEKTLKIEVIQGGLAPYTGTLRAVFGQPGLYALDLLPTVAGQYRYRISGTVGTTTVNETFESGPTTFNDVQPTTQLQYPTKVPVGDELATQLADAQDAARSARVLGIVGILMGLLALILVLATARARRTP